MLLQRDENATVFPRYHSSSSCRMRLRCYHIFTLLRELPFAAILSFHGNRSAVSSTNPCYASHQPAFLCESRSLHTIPRHRVYDVSLYHISLFLSSDFIKKKRTLLYISQKIIYLEIKERKIQKIAINKAKKSCQNKNRVKKMRAERQALLGLD